MAGLTLQLLALKLIRNDGAGLVHGPTDHQRLGLRQTIGDKKFVVMGEFILMPLSCNQELTRNYAATLMNKLIKGVLSVGSRFAPNYRTGVNVRVIPVHQHRFAI